MWTPLAVLFLAIGVINTPAMIEAERQYQNEPRIEVQDIQAVQADQHRPVLTDGIGR